MNLNRTTIAIIAVVAMIGLAGCAAYLPGDDTNEPHDAIPEESNMVVYADLIGLAEDDATEEVVEGIGTEMGEPEGFYEEQYTELVNELNAELAEEFESTEITVDTVQGVYYFGEHNMELDADVIEEEEDFGVLIDTDLTAEELESLSDEVSDEEEVTTREYAEYTVVTDFEDDGQFVVLDAEQGLIAFSEDEEYMNRIIDTYTGESASVSEDMVPDEDVYMSASISDVDGVWSEIQAEMSEIENDPLYQELDEEEREQLEQLDGISAPQSIMMTYSADAPEMTLQVSATFANEDAASEWERLFTEDTPDNVDVEVSVDSTTVTATYTTTTDAVVDGVIGWYEEFLGMGAGTYEEPALDFAEVDVVEEGDTAFVTVEQLPEGEYINVDVVSDRDTSEFEITDHTAEDWSVADEEGQVIEVSPIQDGDMVGIFQVADENDTGVFIEIIER